MKKAMSRRGFLKGAGAVAIGLPFMDLMLGAWGAQAAEIEVPKRLVTFFFANGCPPALWLPQGVGRDFVLDRALAPLEGLRSKIALVSGLHDPAGKAGSGDDHSRGSGAFCVGHSNPYQESDSFDASGKRFASSAGGASLEQFARERLRPQTLLGSLEVATMRGAPFSRTYHIKSWRGVNQPNPPILNPLDTCDRIFGVERPTALPTDGEARQARYQQSVLDTILPEYHRVTSERYGLSAMSRTMIGDHLDAVRELERRATLNEREMLAACLRPDQPQSYAETRYSEYAEVFKLQAELVAMALRCDVTRFSSVMLGAGGEGFKLSEFEGAHHELGHQWNARPDNDFVVYTRFQMELFAHFLRALDSPEHLEANGKSVLENSVVLAGTEISNPSNHDHDEMLYMVAGGAGAIRTGYHHRIGDKRAVNDLYTSCLHAVGVDAPSFGAAEFNKQALELG
ncbi:MAG: DUF1552 domain-containing protein [Bradymonadaceae bacterium]|nr:DUF1552 domain-containing protein [Lujinxingiaceae bacterium]